MAPNLPNGMNPLAERVEFGAVPKHRSAMARRNRRRTCASGERLVPNLITAYLRPEDLG